MHKEYLQLSIIENLTLKSRQSLNRHFSTQNIQMANNHMRKMLNICYQGNANSNHNEMLLPIFRLAKVEKGRC